MQTIGIEQCIPLSFQDTGSESLLPEPFRNLDGSIIQPHIRLLQHLALRHPLQKQVPADTHIRRRQSLNTIKKKPTKACFWAIAYSSFQSAFFKEEGISESEPMQNLRKSKNI